MGDVVHEHPVGSVSVEVRIYHHGLLRLCEWCAWVGHRSSPPGPPSLASGPSPCYKIPRATPSPPPTRQRPLTPTPTEVSQMTGTKVFSIEIEVVEHPDHTEARAQLQLGDEPRGGWGRARRNPNDPDRPRIGDELAIARALSDLAHHLLDDVATQIETAEGTHPRLHL